MKASALAAFRERATYRLTCSTQDECVKEG